jgi:hypothetical protein
MTGDFAVDEGGEGMMGIKEDDGDQGDALRLWFSNVSVPFSKPVTRFRNYPQKGMLCVMTDNFRG